WWVAEMGGRAAGWAHTLDKSAKSPTRPTGSVRWQMETLVNSHY
ncbi:MAG: hypothetical protein AVDCRST_MAG93-5547, partial [uncultured Chloroflexia bacterium]